MLRNARFAYLPVAHEKEKASYAYLVSIVAFVVGLPLPITNLIATVGYWIGCRRSTYFVRWHATQAIFTQLFILPFNSVAFWWLLHQHMHSHWDRSFFFYLPLVLLLNLAELIGTIVTATRVREGIHVRWWVYASLTDSIVRSDNRMSTPVYWENK